MTHICTIADKNYLLKALALIESIHVQLKGDYTIYFLCIDRDTHDKMSELNLANVQTFLVEDFELGDPDLYNARSNPPSQYGDQHSQFCWTLTPYFINYLLKQVLQPNEYLMYCDADIYWLRSPLLVLAGDKSIAMHTHRFSNNNDTPVGRYNIGVTVFKKDAKAMFVSDSWKGWLLNHKNEYAEQYGTCGDQKYAELFEQLIGRNNIWVFDEDEPAYLHLAPWCTHLDGDKKPIFFHFSHFTLVGQLGEIAELSWKDSDHGEWNPSSIDYIRPYYDEYFRVQKSFSAYINLIEQK